MPRSSVSGGALGFKRQSAISVEPHAAYRHPSGGAKRIERMTRWLDGQKSKMDSEMC
jgi:hypothetical protein